MIDAVHSIRALQADDPYLYILTYPSSPHTPIKTQQSPKGIALRNMLRSEFRRNANVSEPKQVEQLKMKCVVRARF